MNIDELKQQMSLKRKEFEENLKVEQEKLEQKTKKQYEELRQKAYEEDEKCYTYLDKLINNRIKALVKEYQSLSWLTNKNVMDLSVVEHCAREHVLSKIDMIKEYDNLKKICSRKISNGSLDKDLECIGNINELFECIFDGKVKVHKASHDYDYDDGHWGTYYTYTVSGSSYEK